jgi:hypothetical protein
MTDHDQWTADVADMTEMQRAATELAIRHAAGLCGDLDDERQTT